MWLHIVIFVILLLLTVCSTLGWIHVENIGTVKGRKDVSCGCSGRKYNRRTADLDKRWRTGI